MVPDSNALCSGTGQFHTDKATCPTCKPYQTITLAEIISMVDSQKSVAKENAPWFIPSTLKTREATKQRESGQYFAVWCDFDEHTELSHIKAVLAELCCFYIIYSSRSATLDRQKWRVIIPLATPANATEWQQIAAIINDKFEAAGIVPDRASERVNQICYLPNKGEFYRSHIESTLDYLDWSNTLAAELLQKRQAAQRDKEHSARLIESSRLKAIERMQSSSLSPIEAYNAAYSIEQSLACYGYRKSGNKWLSPNSESGNPGVTVKDEKWISGHGSDAGIGKPCTGGTMGDAFDLFTFYDHNGNHTAALKAAGEMFTLADGKTITKQNQLNHAKANNPEPPRNSPINAPPTSTFNDTQTPSQTKNSAIEALLLNIEKTDLTGVCKSLGWSSGTDDKPPKEKHFKVAIIRQLIEVAKLNNWIIIHNAGFFYIYTGAYWIALGDAEVKQLLKNAAIKMGYPEIECLDSAFVDKLFQQAEQDGFFAELSLEKQSIINLKNGSLVLDSTGVKLKPFDYRDFLTHQLNFSYDSTAVNRLFLDYLADVLPDADTRRTLQQIAGYLFIKGLKMEKIFFLFGTGANGKSVFYEVLNGVIGSENISSYSLESLTDDSGYSRAMIKDKIVNYGTDIRLTKIDAGRFKTLASGEPIDARLPYRDPFIMTDYAKLIFNVNKMDSANIEHTNGFYRRLLIVPFNKTIPTEKQDRDLHTKILKDKAGVLNWIIAGAEQVIQNRDIFISAECENFKAQFLKETDSVAMFEEHFRETMTRTIYFETVNDSHRDYKSFCIDAGYKPLGRTNFTKRMETLGFEKRKLKDGWMLEKNFSEML